MLYIGNASDPNAAGTSRGICLLSTTSPLFRQAYSSGIGDALSGESGIPG